MPIWPQWDQRDLGEKAVQDRDPMLMDEGDASAAGELVFHVFGAIAQFEWRLIAERIRDGVAAARAEGRRLALSGLACIMEQIPSEPLQGGHPHMGPVGEITSVAREVHAVIYQIFPERFAIGKPLDIQTKLAQPAYQRDGFTRHAHWDEEPTGGSDFFGGDLGGAPSSWPRAGLAGAGLVG